MLRPTSRPTNYKVDDFMTFELDADDFEFDQGVTIPPGYEIGIDSRTGSAVCLNCWGKVASAYYSPMNHSYRVMIVRITTPVGSAEISRRHCVTA